MKKGGGVMAETDCKCRLPRKWIELQEPPPLLATRVRILVKNIWGPEYDATREGELLEKPYVVVPDCSADLRSLAQHGWLTHDGLMCFRLEFLEDLAEEVPVELGSDYKVDMLANMWSEMEHTDFFIVSGDGQEIHCHRAVLAAASPVFKGMLASSLQEGLQKFATVDESAKVITTFLNFLYTGQVPFDVDCPTLLGLLRSADYYQISDLLDLCAGRLGPLLSEENIVDVIECTRVLQSGNIKNRTILKFVQNQVRSTETLFATVCANVRACPQSPEVQRSSHIHPVSGDGSALGQSTQPCQVDDAPSASSECASSVISLGTQLTHCFMLDTVFKTVSGENVFYLPAQELQKGSQVLADDDKTIVEIVNVPELYESDRTIELSAGDALLRVTPDHRIPAFQETGGELCDIQASNLMPTNKVLVNGLPTPLSSVKETRLACKTKVLKLAFKPDVPVGAFSCPQAISSKGSKKK
jgi:hypothetical protein